MKNSNQINAELLYSTAIDFLAEKHGVDPIVVKYMLPLDSNLRTQFCELVAEGIIALSAV